MRNLFLLVLLMGGCSQVERIGTDAQRIRESATSTIDHLEVIMETDDFGVVEVEAAAAISDQEEIVEYVDDILLTLPKVRDATPWWATLLSRVSVAASVLGVAFLFWHLGIGHLIKKVCWAIGWFIPASSMRSAELDLKVERQNMSAREAIAARRGADPSYEAARKQAKKRIV
jgi:Na+-transporting methylmalonyl-CoA/oxaloacetate decarboxylase gamma subunit|tara:strand:+ start:583 stop:1101 length:519 start_codon:yes stop_codon:yes gene_type:complete